MCQIFILDTLTCILLADYRHDIGAILENCSICIFVTSGHFPIRKSCLVLYAY